MKYVKANFSEILNNLIVFAAGGAVLIWIGGEFIAFFLTTYALAFIFIELRAALLIDKIEIEISESDGSVLVGVKNSQKIKAYNVALEIKISGPEGTYVENKNLTLKTFSQKYELLFGNYFHNLFIDKGYYRISVEARIGDWFNIFAQHVVEEKNFAVYPNYNKDFQDPKLLDKLLTDAPERTVIRQTEKTVRGDVADEILDIRPFNYQDQLNRINWSLSAHSGELMTNIYENQVLAEEETSVKDNFCAVILDLTTIRGELFTITKLIYDCISVVNYLLNNGWKIEFHYFNGTDKIIGAATADDICKELLTVPYNYAENAETRAFRPFDPALSKSALIFSVFNFSAFNLTAFNLTAFNSTGGESKRLK
jgi:hypothetical protein